MIRLRWRAERLFNNNPLSRSEDNRLCCDEVAFKTSLTNTVDHRGLLPQWERFATQYGHALQPPRATRPPTTTHWIRRCERRTTWPATPIASSTAPLVHQRLLHWAG